LLNAGRPRGFAGLIIQRMKFTTLGYKCLGAVLAASLAGCGGFSLGSLNPWSGPVERGRMVPADATEYACDGGKRLVVQRLPGAVMIMFPERDFRLDQAAAGARYTNGSTTLLLNGDQVSLEEEGVVTFTACRKAPA